MKKNTAGSLTEQSVKSKIQAVRREEVEQHSTLASEAF